ncbi:MAG: acyl carrier protein [Bryobacteraceae bacterium]
MSAKQENAVGRESIENWLVDYLAELLELDGADIAHDESLASYGLDSSGAVGLVGDLGAWLGRELDPALLYSYPTIETLTGHLLKEEHDHARQSE